MTRCGVPSKVMPSQSAIGVSADQSSVAVPASVSRDASNASQSDTSPGLLAASGTALPVAQSLCSISSSQNGRPSCSRSLFRTSPNPEGMHPVNSLPARYSHLRLARAPSSSGISPVKRL